MSGKIAPDPDQLEREQRILELRRAGATWETIAARTGYASASGAHKAYQRLAERFVKPALNELREMELDRLDRLQAGVWGKAITGDIRALDAVLRIIDRRARLLGLEAPKEVNLKAEVNTYDRDSIDAEVARLVALLDGGSPRELAQTESQTRPDTNTGQ
jgi:hypothetical protein